MKKILLQLNNLKNIKADSEWKARSREILLSQISGSFNLEKNTETGEMSFSCYLKNFLRQPALVVAVIMIVVLGGGGLSIGASFDSRPGESLYIAKMISEKAQLTFTFDEKEKARLNIEFAKNRAKEISQVLEAGNGEEKSATVEKLSNNFKKEISASKERLSKTNIANMVIKDDNQVFSATAGRSEEGIEIHDAVSGQDVVVQPEISDNQVSATSSNNNITIRKIGVNEALDEAEKLFSEHDYSGALNKLNEVGDIIDGNVQPVENNNGEVLGEKSENATSTGE